MSEASDGVSKRRIGVVPKKPEASAKGFVCGPSLALQATVTGR